MYFTVQGHDVIGNFARDKASYVRLISVGSNIPWLCVYILREVFPENYYEVCM
jgi:hypothetical protein